MAPCDHRFAIGLVRPVGRLPGVGVILAILAHGDGRPAHQRQKDDLLDADFLGIVHHREEIALHIRDLRRAHEEELAHAFRGLWIHIVSNQEGVPETRPQEELMLRNHVQAKSLLYFFPSGVILASMAAAEAVS